MENGKLEFNNLFDVLLIPKLFLIFHNSDDYYQAENNLLTQRLQFAAAWELKYLRNILKEYQFH